MTVSFSETINRTAHMARIEVRPAPGTIDPAGQALLREARAAFGSVTAMHVARLYLIQSTLTVERLQRIAEELLTDPVNERAVIGATTTQTHEAVVEVHPKPGVMDPAALSTEAAIREMMPDPDPGSVTVRTGYRYQFEVDPSATPPEPAALHRFAERHLANPVIEAIHEATHWPDRFPAGEAYERRIERVSIRDLDEAGLEALSRDGHLFLSLEEMRAIRDYYRAAGREPTDIELETLAQTWSEHCVHKTLKSTVHYTHLDMQGEDASSVNQTDPLAIFRDKAGHEIHHDGSVTIHNLMKSTIAAATHRLMQHPPHDEWCVSVFEDNAGIVKLDETHGLCIKVETHNHPSAIEPYGGAATGIGGCIRDIIGTGQAAKPIANTDVFCVAPPDHWRDADEEPSDDSRRRLPSGMLHPKRILQQVVAGVRDYGNRMGIPTVNGAVYFDDDYIGNPLVFAGCAGLIPLERAFGEVRAGDHIIALGGRTGRDGIHGATFSSAELTDSHAEEFAHAVQIGNPITEKKMLDVILQARDREAGPLFNAITDCGAGGFSSAVGEMAEHLGAHVDLDRAPLKYAGLSYTEIWISEAQERMVLAVPPGKVETLQMLCHLEDVELCDLGRFGCTDADTDKPTLVLSYEGAEVGRLDMGFLHNGLPTPTRTAQWGGAHATDAPTQTHPNSDARDMATDDADAINPRQASPGVEELDAALEVTLRSLLAHPNIASKHWIVRQYDHEVQGASVVKPLTGPMQGGPSDGAVLRPKFDSDRGMVLAGGLAPALSEQAAERGLSEAGDSYWATLAAMDEAIRNAVCVGADAKRIALLDNFCWPGCDDPQQLGALVRAAVACHDGALAYAAPFISGKDSLNNQFTADNGGLIRIPQTLLITAMGLLDYVTRACTMDAKQAGHYLVMVGETAPAMGGSHYAMIHCDSSVIDRRIPRVDTNQGPANAAAVSDLIERELIHAAHDCADGGLLVAAAEMAFSAPLGLDLDLTALPTTDALDALTRCFAETPSRYLLEIDPEDWPTVEATLRQREVPAAVVGTFNATPQLSVRNNAEVLLMDADLADLRQCWRAPLDW